MSAYPPKLAQRFLVRLVPSGIVGESIVGDAHEEYLEQIARVGSMRARLWYWSHVLNIALKYRNRRTTESAGHGGSGTALAGLAQDFRFTWRSLGRSAAFTSVVVGTLGIGIGATTAIFSVVNGVLLKPLPFPESDRLVTVWLQLPGIGLGQMGQARATYFTFRDEQRVLEDIGLWRTNSVTITGLSEPEVVPILQVTDGTLPLLGTQPVLGRRFTASDDTPGTPLTVMLSHGFWQRHYGGDAGAIGQMLALEDTQAEIIGVLPPEFQLMWADPAFVLPLRLDRSRASVGAFNYPVSGWVKWARRAPRTSRFGTSNASSKI